MDDPNAEEISQYGQYCPISRAVEVLGERWSVLIVRDLLCGFTRFNELARGNPGLSRTLLSKRLRQLERAGIVEHVEDQYLLTPAGLELHGVVFGMGEWAARWQFHEPRQNELDPELLMWWLHRRIDFSHLPDRRIVLEFRFSDHPMRYWIMKDTQGPSVCTYDPGFGIDATIASDLSTLYEVWLGKLALRTATDRGDVRISGLPLVLRGLPQAFLLSPIADVVAAVNR